MRFRQNSQQTLQKYLTPVFSFALFGLFLVWQSSAGAVLVTQANDQTAQTTYTLSIDTRTIHHEISPNIYGINFATYDMANQLNLPINRYGGNAASRYNWKTSSTNLGHDWYFMNKAEGADSGNLPHGSATDLFVEQNQSTGTDSLLTLPLLGWVSKSREDSCGFSVSKYGAQDKTEPWHPDCGNGTLIDKSNGSGRILNADPTDTSIAVDEEFVQEWIIHLNGKYGTADNGGVRLYSMDNEPMLWFYTHQDVHPEPTSYDEIRDLTYRYAPSVKEIDPAAEIIGPSVWGWNAYFTSAVDQNSINGHVDKAAHGGTPFLEWYLQQMAAYEAENDTRILDYLDLHHYPQGTGITLASAGDLATQERRLRSTRALWDRTYTDNSWINRQIYLIPRMHDWVDGNYPGTKLSISEYNFGGLEHINGAVTQADVLGIYGRENLHMAFLWDWTNLKLHQPWSYAFRMYRNYDGQKSTFGDQNVSAVSSNEWDIATFAARRSSDDALTIMVINKTYESATAQVELTGLISSGAAEVYQYSDADLSNIQNLGSQSINNDQLVRELPGHSITLFVIKDGTYEPAPPPPTPTPAPSPTLTATPNPDDDPLQGGTPGVLPPTNPAYRWQIAKSESRKIDLGWAVIDVPAETFVEDVYLELDFPKGYSDPGTNLSNPFDSKTVMQFSLSAYRQVNGSLASLAQNKKITIRLLTGGEIAQLILDGDVSLYEMNLANNSWENVQTQTRISETETVTFTADTFTSWALISNKQTIFLPLVTN